MILKDGFLNAFSLYLAGALILFSSITSAQSIKLSNSERDQRLLDRLDMMFGDVYSSIRYADTKQLTDSLFNNYNLLPKDLQPDAVYYINQFNFGKHKELKNKKTSPQVGEFTASPYPNSQSTTLLKSNRPILKYFYKNPHHLYSINTKNFSLQVNPILNISAGPSSANGFILNNTRGARIEGYIDDKFYFASQILETQARLPQHVTDWTNEFKSLPGNGLYKDFTSGVIENFKGFDYLNASGYIGLPIVKSVSIELGHGRHFWGNGQRSLLLSDFSNNYLYLQLNTKVWKFNYQNIFAELQALGTRDQLSDVLIPKKYMATHMLSFKPWKWAEVSLFESVIFSRENQFELQYLNPVIFYRSIEQSLGSPDNVMLGLNVSTKHFNHLQLYGQIVVDEFKISELGTGWWGNKFAFQGGAKYFNLFDIPYFDIQVEWNQVRPFTYAQSRSIAVAPQYTVTSYSHFKQPLAHPLGANFNEVIVDLRYRWQDLFISCSFTTFKQSQDLQGNSGKNILLNTDTQFQEYGNEVAGLDPARTTLLNLQLSYEIFPNLFIESSSVWRQKFINDVYSTLGIRYNIKRNNWRF